MKRIFTFFIGILLASFNLFAQQTTSDLLISEYCEYNHTASSPQYFNHYIEIYNGTGETIDMSQYQLWRAQNGGGWHIDGDGISRGPLNLRGTLENNKCYVITRPNTNSNPITIAGDSAQSWDFLNISGDDAIGLAKNDGNGNFELIDVIGTPNEDPGNYWSVAGYDNGTQDRTIIRKATVCSPTTNWSTSAGTSEEDSEWLVYPQNDISNINQHTCNCGGTSETDTTTVHTKYSALFIGNSYTYYNDLPILIDRLANSTGDTLNHKESYPGGYRLSQHYDLVATQNAIKASNYDYVILQEQSQRPALDSALFFESVLKFDSIRRIFSPCGQTMLYMTWGRKYGDTNNCASNPNVCTYEGMDSVLCASYLIAQEKINGLISPVGRVRNYLIHNYPDIELYVEDYSHPTAEGSFVSAATFYTVMFKKDPTLTSYNFSLNEETATIIKEAVKTVVFNKLEEWNTYSAGADSSISLSISNPVSTDTLINSEIYTAEIDAVCQTGEIDKIEVYLNGELLDIITEAPYSISFSTTKNGKNNLIAIAYNKQGNKNFFRTNFYVQMLTNIATHDAETRIFRLYPNPAETLLNIEIQKSFTNGDYSIYDLSGRKVISGSLSAPKNTCIISSLTPGIYAIKLQVENTIQYQKFSKK